MCVILNRTFLMIEIMSHEKSNPKYKAKNTGTFYLGLHMGLPLKYIPKFQLVAQAILCAVEGHLLHLCSVSVLVVRVQFKVLFLNFNLAWDHSIISTHLIRSGKKHMLHVYPLKCFI